MLPTNTLKAVLLVAGLALGGLIVHAADSPDFLFGLGTDFFSGLMFGAAIALAIRATSSAPRQP